ncbi:MAG: hypothetical protein KUG53_04110, partial [Pseudomonadales bacterium]|nr:hypothetical protein [Pseudomonadales bacterium]
AKVVAVSPIVGGKAIKGPAAKMMTELGVSVDPVAIAKHYGDLLDGLVIDQLDIEQAQVIRANGLPVLATDTMMIDLKVKQSLAKQVLDFGLGLF